MFYEDVNSVEDVLIWARNTKVDAKSALNAFRQTTATTNNLELQTVIRLFLDASWRLACDCLGYD